MTTREVHRDIFSYGGLQRSSPQTRMIQRSEYPRWIALIQQRMDTQNQLQFYPDIHNERTGIFPLR